MRFGDIVENAAPGRKNPQRVLMFIACTSQYARFLSTVGREVKFYRSDLKKGWFVPTGKRVDFSEWMELANAATIEPAAAGKGAT